MPTMQHTVLDFTSLGGGELIAEIDVEYIEASGDGWHEPHEPASASLSLTGLYKVTRRFNTATGKIDTISEQVECSNWLRDLILAEAQEEADADIPHDDRVTRAEMIAEARYDEMRGK